MHDQPPSTHASTSYPLMFDSPTAQTTPTPPASVRQVSAFPHPLSNSHQPPQSDTRPSLPSRDSIGPSPSSKRGAMSKLPSEQAGRALIAYEIDQVAWIHSAYQSVRASVTIKTLFSHSIFHLLTCRLLCQSSYVCCGMRAVLGGRRVGRGRSQPQLVVPLLRGPLGASHILNLLPGQSC